MTRTEGLKQMVAKAIKQSVDENVEPVEVSDEAVRSLSTHMRAWSGWRNSHVEIGDPRSKGLDSPWAACHHPTRTFVANADRLVLNPNRVLLTVTPFRMRQEAVLTGALLHEAGHARHTRWLPRTDEDARLRPLLHSDDGSGDEPHRAVPTSQVVALARLMEEPRVEGLMARDADSVGAKGLDWTMRASAAHLLPTTRLSMDPSQRLMDLLSSWALRAGRQIALNHWTGHTLRNWVQDFTTLMHSAIEAHLKGLGVVGVTGDVRLVMDTLIEMIVCTDDTGPTMIDKARLVLDTLFPETDPDDQPTPGEGCSMDEPEDDEDESEDSDTDEGEAEPEEAEPEEAEQDDEGEGEGEAEPEEDDSDEGDGEPEDSEPEDSEPEDTDPNGLAQALAAMEAAAKSETADEAGEEAEIDPSDDEVSGGVGDGDGENTNGYWRLPNKAERETQKNAERFLRGLIAPSESSKVTLDDSPAATVDGAAMAQWKAGGQHSAPKFFRRIRRTVEPSPPVQIAILSDISGSMEELQAPSALLSWALASAALDLRNFAGRGQQIESCLIHWGWDAKVIQGVGQNLPGIYEVPCFEGTSAMHTALALVEEQMPGFFDVTERPVNRLLVHFTDWELDYMTKDESIPYIQRALEAGVSMLTVAPQSYSERRSDLSTVLSACKVQRGKSSLFKYNPMFPEQVWETAAEALG